MQAGRKIQPGDTLDVERDLLALEAIALELGMLTRSVGALAERLRLASEPGRREAKPAPARTAPPALTAREREVVALLRRGLSNKEIALTLAIRPATAKAHVRSIMDKLGARTRTEAAVRAAELLGETPAGVAA